MTADLGTARQRASAAHGAAIALVTVLGACSPGATSTATAPLATAAVPRPTPTALAPTQRPSEPPASAAEADWRRITALDAPDLGDPDVDLQMEAVAARATGAVAIGIAYVCCTEEFLSRAWFSPDGVAWALVDIAAGGATYTDVAAGAGGYVVVGFIADADGPQAAAWWSSDGRDWTTATIANGDAVRLTGVEAVPDGYLALASVEGGERNSVEVWTSTDGRSWARLSEPDALGVGARASDIAVGASGIVIVGAAFGRSPGSTWEAATWTSADGRAWTPNPPSDRSGSEMRRVVWLEDHFVAVGNTVDAEGALGGNPAAWVSVDGRRWEAATVPGGDAGRPVVINGLTVGGRGVVAVGPSPNGTVGVWISSDGWTWVLVPNHGGLAAPTEDLTGRFEPTDVAAMGDRLLVVGSFPRDPRRDAAVWINPSPS